MPPTLHIDLVPDVVCPWCVAGPASEQPSPSTNQAWAHEIIVAGPASEQPSPSTGEGWEGVEARCVRRPAQGAAAARATF